MDYRFLDRGPEELRAAAELPVNGGVCLAVRVSGYDQEADDVVEIAIADFDGVAILHSLVKPQNAGEWGACEASGGLGPADVEGAPELYELEDEIAGALEGASIVVCQHLDYARTMLEGAWITLPSFTGFDLLEQFRLAHATSESPHEPATVASLEGACAYYGLAPDARADGESSRAGKALAVGESDRADDALADGGHNADSTPDARADGEPSRTGGALAEARKLAQVYRAFVAEHVRERDAKPTSYWEQNEAERARQAAEQERLDAANQAREKRISRMNGMMWVVGAILFTSAVIQSSQAGADPSLLIVFAIGAIFCLARAVMCFKH